MVVVCPECGITKPVIEPLKSLYLPNDSSQLLKLPPPLKFYFKNH